MDNELLYYNYAQLNKMNNKDKDVTYFNNLVRGLSDNEIEILYSEIKDNRELQRIFWAKIIKVLRNQSLFELAIQCGYISNRLPKKFVHNFKKYIYPVFENFIELEEQFPLIKSLKNNIEIKGEDFEVNFNYSFFEFLSQFMNLEGDTRIDQLIVGIKFDYDYEEKIQNIFDKLSEDSELSDVELDLVETCLSFFEFLICFDNFMIDTVENESTRKNYLEFYNYIIHDSKIFDFISHFIEKYETLDQNSLDLEYSIELSKNNFISNLKIAIENLRQYEMDIELTPVDA